MVVDVKMRGGGHSGVVKDLEKLHKITPRGLESLHVVRKGICHLKNLAPVRRSAITGGLLVLLSSLFTPQCGSTRTVDSGLKWAQSYN